MIGLSILILASGCTGPSIRLHPDTGAAAPELADALSPPTGTSAASALDTGSDVRTACLDAPPPAGEADLPVTPEGATALPVGPGFDFDDTGEVVTSLGPDLVRIDALGEITVLVPGIGRVTGVRSLPWGDHLVVNLLDVGMTVLVDRQGLTPLVGGMVQPTALDVDVHGNVYTAEFTQAGDIWQIDPATGAGEHLIALPYPRAIALSPDESTLYIATSQDRNQGPGRIAAIDRSEDGAWDPTTLREIHVTEWRVGSLATDVCGNLYVGEIETARVYRLRATDGSVDPIADLGPGMWLSSLRFGGGLGGFDQETLYASIGGMLFAVPIGLDGYLPPQ